jgi:TPR repeat protein
MISFNKIFRGFYIMTVVFATVNCAQAMNASSSASSTNAASSASSTVAREGSTISISTIAKDAEEAEKKGAISFEGMTIEKAREWIVLGEQYKQEGKETQANSCYRAAVENLRPLAVKKQIPRAQRYLAWCHEFGKGVAPSMDNAILYYRLAARKDDYYAQVRLAEIYQDGIGGVERNGLVALHWREQAELTAELMADEKKEATLAERAKQPAVERKQ